MKPLKRFMAVSLMLFGICILFANAESIQAKSVNSVVKHTRKIYYTTNSKLKSYKKTGIKGCITDYWDMKKQYLVKTVTYPNYYSDIKKLKKCSIEYYYDSNLHLVFAFAYKKENGKIKAYRAYYGSDGRLYRFINANGKIKDYKNGKKMDYEKNKLPDLLYKQGIENFIVGQESWIPDSEKIF